jgi:cob(I)alamin adenosyltransferase
MKIYTKTGDDGTTGLFGGGRVRKASTRVEAYGTAVVAIGTTGNLVFAGATYTAVVSSSSVAYAVGELIKQSLTFKVRS